MCTSTGAQANMGVHPPDVVQLSWSRVKTLPRIAQPAPPARHTLFGVRVSGLAPFEDPMRLEVDLHIPKAAGWWASQVGCDATADWMRAISSTDAEGFDQIVVGAQVESRAVCLPPTVRAVKNKIGVWLCSRDQSAAILGSHASVREASHPAPRVVRFWR